MVICGGGMKSSILMMLMACQHSSAEPQSPPQSLKSSSNQSVSAKTWIRERWNAARADHQWHPPSPKAQTDIAQAIHKLLLAAPDCHTQTAQQMATHLEVHGLKIDTFHSDTDKFWFIYEPQKGKGHGAIAIRCGKASDIVLQAPHAIYDQWTGAIVRDLFASHPFRMAMWNTTHRYKANQGTDKDQADHPADVAHNRDSVFHQVSLQLLLNTPLRFAQFHGFAQDSDWEIILSLGAEDAQATQLASRLKPLSEAVGLYGSTASILGATTNVLAKAVSTEERGRFVHIELNKALRETLKADSAKKQTLAEALKQPW